MIRAFVVAVAVTSVLGLVSRVETVTREQARLRSHFDTVLVELRARDVSGMFAGQIESRRRMIEWLAEYRDAGSFPLNDGYADGSSPIFRDARGVTCAMAYLIERSGRHDLVDRVSATRNLAYIRELVNDTSLVGWLDASGLDVAEAARIQPAYEQERELHYTVGATAVTVGLSAISLYTAHANVFRPSELRGFAGILVGGVTSMAAVVISLHDYPVLTGINAFSGGSAILAGLYAAFRPRDTKPGDPSADSMEERRLSPLTQWSPQTGTRIGLAVKFCRHFVLWQSLLVTNVYSTIT